MVKKEFERTNGKRVGRSLVEKKCMNILIFLTKVMYYLSKMKARKQNFGKPDLQYKNEELKRKPPGL